MKNAKKWRKWWGIGKGMKKVREDRWKGNEECEGKEREWKGDKWIQKKRMENEMKNAMKREGKWKVD